LVDLARPGGRLHALAGRQAGAAPFQHRLLPHRVVWNAGRQLGLELALPFGEFCRRVLEIGILGVFLLELIELGQIIRGLHRDLV
jgi:hypothetical protein